MQSNEQAQMRETDKDIAADIHYPDCWDTAAYPRLIDAIRQLAHCAGCEECEAAQQNTASTEPSSVPIPKNADEAELMQRTGYFWLEQFAPERLRPKYTREELVDIVARLQANGWEYGTHPTIKAGIVINALIAAGALQVKAT